MKKAENIGKIVVCAAGIGIITFSGIMNADSLRSAFHVPSSALPTKHSNAVSQYDSSVQVQTLGLVDIQYNLINRQSLASNQIALWIEDADHNCVKTLVASSFTARGGYRRRPESLPEWRAAASWDKANQEEIDSVSLPMQTSGVYHVYWDCTDKNEKPVMPGTYYIRMEGNIFWSNRVNFSIVINLGGQNSSASATPTFLPNNDRSNGTILKDVSASYFPGKPLSSVKQEVITSTRGS